MSHPEFWDHRIVYGQISRNPLGIPAEVAKSVAAYFAITTRRISTLIVFNERRLLISLREVLAKFRSSF
jgi:hypothetical protein